MIGSGRAHVAEVADMARANHLPSGAVECFATLGTEGKWPSNQERDLHRWLQCLFGVSLRPYQVQMEVNVFCLLMATFVVFGVGVYFG